MSDLVAFLTARYDEDEAEANDFHDALRCGSLDRDGGFDLSSCDCGMPARVLREAEAKRKILADYELLLAERKSHPGDLAQAGALLALRGVVRALAAVYSDHPDYDKDWA